MACGRAARLDRGDDETLIGHPDARHIFGGRHDAFDLLGIGVGILRRSRPVDRDVPRRFRPQLRGIGPQRSARVDHRRELFIVHGHKLGRVLRGQCRFRDDDRDRLADMHHALAGERRPIGQNELLAAAAGERGVAADIADAGRIHVRCGEDGEHAGRILGLIDRDAANMRKGMRRADERRIGLPGLGDIGREVAGAAHQIIVLDPRSAGRMAIGGL